MSYIQSESFTHVFRLSSQTTYRLIPPIGMYSNVTNKQAFACLGACLGACHHGEIDGGIHSFLIATYISIHSLIHTIQSDQGDNELPINCGVVWFCVCVSVSAALFICHQFSSSRSIFTSFQLSLPLFLASSSFFRLLLSAQPMAHTHKWIHHWFFIVYI